MIDRHVLRATCALCIMGVTGLSALAAMPTDDPTPIDVNRGVINLDQAPAKDAPKPAQIGNPLWAIPLGSLSITRDRPLFTPSRRPPAPAVVATPRVVPPKPVVRPAEPEHPNLTLIGTVVGKSEGIGVFLDQATRGFVRLKTGQGHSGWVLRSIKAREVTLEKEQRTETLSLPAPQVANSPTPTRNRPE